MRGQRNHGGLLMIADGDRKPGLLVVSRKYRSKWWTATCGCPHSRRRKDGSCRHLRILLECSPVADRIRIDPVPMGSRTKGASRGC